ncbi:hypothetical protein BDN67DRAFT_127805 [Paxillus ammoniavirescens]|nr:hypothetical protein BDN67DRAFT_127805 [Paxillus ammoniavirescens]
MSTMTPLLSFATVLLVIHSCYSLPTDFDTSPELQVDAFVSAQVCTHVRSILGIIFLCIVSLVACSWNAVHPNIPGVDESRWIIWLRRVLLMVLVVITPELLLVWVLQQFTSAGSAAQAFNKWRATSVGGSQYEAWNRTHGFFAEMGGFQLYVNGVSYCPLTVGELTRYIDRGAVTVPPITEEEIRDRSKNDGFNKLLAVGQVVWFIFQFIVRVAYKLPPTLLEIETLRLIMLSFITWGLWWKKPKDVYRPYRIEWKLEESPTELELGTATRHGFVDALIRPIVSASRLHAIKVVSESAVKARRVPTFHSGCLDQRAAYNKQDRKALLLMTGATVLFGSVHFFSVIYPFPTPFDRRSWFFCTGALLSLPLIFSCGACFRSDEDFLPAKPLSWVIEFLLAAVTLFYLCIRLITFILLVQNFRPLPSGTLQVVCWMTSVPHLFS